MATKATIIDHFNEDIEQWNQYLERLEIAFTYNKVKEENKTITLLHCIGPSTYSRIRDLVQPTRPSDCTYDNIVKALTDYYCPKPNEISEAFKFHSRRQHEGEDISTF